MNNNNHHKQNCSFGEEVVSYLYGEISANAKTAFENHLADCSACTTEVAEFSNVSFSIGEWRDAEFSHLPTPVIEIPYQTARANFKEPEITSGSWVSGLRQLFSLSPALTTASAAMAALVLCFGLVFVAIKFSDKTGVVVADNFDTAKPAISPTKENAISKDAADAPPKSPDVSNLNSPTDSNKRTSASGSKNSDKSSVVPVKSIERSKTFRPNTQAVSPIRQTVPVKDKNNLKPVQAKKVPALDNFEEDEDDSLRLADLFAEIDTDR